MKKKNGFVWIISIVVSVSMLMLSACGPSDEVDTVSETDSLATPSSESEVIPDTGSSSASPTPGPKDADAEPESSANGITPQVTVSDQPVENGSISIEEVISNGPGWVAVYTTNNDGQPDQKIGHTAVSDGENRGVIVQVDPTLAQGRLQALLLTDKGQVGTFENPGPDVPVISGVQIVASGFNITQAAGSDVTPVAENSEEQPTSSSEEYGSSTEEATTAEPAGEDGIPQVLVANQPIVDSKIIIPEIYSVGEAWVVIHKQNADGTMGAMAGFAHLNDGINRSVVVPVNTDVTSSVMFAMLHEDVAKQKTPQFPGDDVPVMFEGEMVAPPFEVTTNTTADVVVTLGSSAATANYLVTGSQLSLYISLDDSPGKSNCTGECLENWRPLIATGPIVTGSGIPQERLGVIILPDGTRQVAYQNAPLYTFAGDEEPGDVNGQGINGSWYLVLP